MIAMQVGAVIDDRYEILAVAGEGGTGPVYKAHDRLLDETVALKTVGGDNGVRALRTAARVAPRGGTRPVGRIHDFGQHDGVRFVALEFVEGLDLRAGTGGAGLAAREACDVVLQLCGALAGSARAESLHRLGLMLYELITGRAFTQDPALPVPAALAPVLHRALHPRAGDRFGSAAEMVVALREAVARLGGTGDAAVALVFDAPAGPPAESTRKTPPDVETMVAMLATGLSEGDVGLRWRSAVALGELGPAAFAAVPVLVQALDDFDPHVRQRAARALARIGPASVTPLLAAVKAPQEHVRFLAAEALTEIGSTARPSASGPEEPAAHWPESRY